MKYLVIPNLGTRLNYVFEHKPLLIGGLAMEYYGLRKAGQDVDYILHQDDHAGLKNQLDKQGLIYLDGENTSGYKEVPEFVDLYGDHGLLIYEFELWNNILRFDYEYLSRDAIEQEHCKIISLEKLLFLKCLAIDQPKYLEDTKLIVQKIKEEQYKNDSLKELNEV
jgi:hypothetical protein